MVALGYAGALTLLLVSLADIRLDALPDAYNCLRESYYGIHGGQYAFIVDEPCRMSSFSLLGFGTSVRLNLDFVHPYSQSVESQSGPPRYVFDPHAHYSDPTVEHGRRITRMAVGIPQEPSTSSQFPA